MNIDRNYVGEGMYRDIILDHYKNRRNYGKIKNCDAKYRDINPICGDEIEINIKLNDSKVSDIKFTGEGCAISQAAASMLTESVINMLTEDLKKLGQEFMLNLLNIPLSPIRIKCAMLPLVAIKKALYFEVREC